MSKKFTFKTAIILVAVFCLGLFCNSTLSSNRIVQKSITERVIFGSEIAWESKKLTGSHYALLANAPSQYHFNLMDSLIYSKKLTKIFSPEHGFATDQADGVVISKTDNYKRIPVVSLYGKHLNPDSVDVAGIDTILIDLQDVGLRFYTYISTVAKVLESAGKYKIPVVILDRPNPLGGEKIEGPVIEDSLKSFVGYLPIPIRYGLTIGELFQMAVSEEWISNHETISLSVVKMKNWKRSDYWNDLNLKWIPTSPNLPTFESVALYSGTCLFEGTNISEGRGTENPFEWIGADFLTADTVKTEFGITSFPESRTPVSIQGKAVRPKYENQKINGYKLKITNWKDFSSLNWTIQFIQNNKSQIKFRKHFYLLWGKQNIYFNQNDFDETEKFKQNRSNYFLY